MIVSSMAYYWIRVLFIDIFFGLYSCIHFHLKYKKHDFLTICKEENAFKVFIVYTGQTKKSTNTNHLQYSLICSDVLEFIKE